MATGDSTLEAKKQLQKLIVGLWKKRQTNWNSFFDKYCHVDVDDEYSFDGLDDIGIYLDEIGEEIAADDDEDEKEASADALNFSIRYNELCSKVAEEDCPSCREICTLIENQKLDSTIYQSQLYHHKDTEKAFIKNHKETLPENSDKTLLENSDQILIISSDESSSAEHSKTSVEDQTKIDKDSFRKDEIDEAIKTFGNLNNVGKTVSEIKDYVVRNNGLLLTKKIEKLINRFIRDTSCPYEVDEIFSVVVYIEKQVGSRLKETAFALNCDCCKEDPEAYAKLEHEYAEASDLLYGDVCVNAIFLYAAFQNWFTVPE